MTTIAVIAAGIAIVSLGVALGMSRRERRRAQRLAAIALRDHRARTFPCVYTGPDTPYGLKSGSACRIRCHKAGNVAEIVTDDGRPWNVRDTFVVRRTGRRAA